MNIDSIALGAGCFWCVEGIFSMIEGVVETEIGYGGGNYPNPTYESVSARPDGHAEITIVKYNTAILAIDKILDVFFAMHNPDKSYVINDKKGSLYRSVILFNSKEQKKQIFEYKLNIRVKQNINIKTEILPFKNFKLVDKKYQNYYSSNPNKPFCRNVITPKILKLKEKGVL